MSTINFPEYARQITDVLNDLVQAGRVSLFDLQIDQRSMLRGFIRGHVNFSNGSALHFREFIDTTLAESKLMYAYHYQRTDGTLAFRYDNALHRPSLSQREHKHVLDELFAAPAPTLQQVLDEILR